MHRGRVWDFAMCAFIRWMSEVRARPHWPTRARAPDLFMHLLLAGHRWRAIVRGGPRRDYPAAPPLSISRRHFDGLAIFWTLDVWFIFFPSSLWLIFSTWNGKEPKFLQIYGFHIAVAFNYLKQFFHARRHNMTMNCKIIFQTECFICEWQKKHPMLASAARVRNAITFSKMSSIFSSSSGR